MPPETGTDDVLKLADKSTRTVVAARIGDGALVHYTKGDLAPLRSKITAYADPAKDSKKGLPRNAGLVARIEELVPPTLADLSDGWLTDENVNPQQHYWVELWLPGGHTMPEPRREAVRGEVRWLLARSNEVIPPRWFTATEREIGLVRLRGDVLIALPIECPEVYEVRRPQRALVPHLLAEQYHGALVSDGLPPDGPPVVVSVMDTGIAEQHPLLRNGIVQPSVSIVVGQGHNVDDTAGHGTRMAGIIGFADLAGQLAAGTPPRLRTSIQNVRVMEGSTAPADDREWWPERMHDATLEAEKCVMERRVINMAIGAEPDPRERRSAWAVAIDQLTYADGRGRLFCLPTGNIEPSQTAATTYPHENLATALATPAEAVNAIAVGAITDLATVPSGSVAVAGEGQLSPFSRCDAGGARPIKPDVVAEGGNWIVDGAMVGPHSSVGLLTTARGHAIGPPLEHTNATSAACSSVSGLLAEIWKQNPGRRPETIRGLLVHSARWTSTMHTQFTNKVDRLRAVGYGAPSREIASYSTLQRPTLVLENEIKLKPDAEKKRRAHLVDLPLPRQVLAGLGDHVVEVSVTLSYFAEPNENLVRNYTGFGLRWRLQAPRQSDASFFRSFNSLATEKDASSGGSFDWEIGESARRRGTVQSDRCRITASELASCGKVAVFPVLGWWERHAERDDRAIRYALIVTLDAGTADVDLYTPIQVGIPSSVPSQIDVDISS
jgi:hypothetical protein